MTLWVLLGTAAGGALLAWLRLKSRGARRLLDVAAVLAYLAFFAEAAHAVMRTLLDDTVFMTQVHEVLLSPLFMAGGGYLGVYALSLLAARAWTGTDS
ncbi:hypothetical protein I8J29_11085 [Paenibacillus sp. MWE-103]|uniref:Lycopene cyclase domain-containing protein n=1 Tax=Paenibacillus artemisiicola TaxID=1172618 RepID=A0ABS3W8U7_9BACL|nr:hypothetical protein [Paenibacillus artemisiicola]MBO7744744.1 hypothetical protein [Paenibacillus artemisiicola]